MRRAASLLAVILLAPGCVQETTDADAVDRALGFFAGQQNADGGFPGQAGDASDFSTSAWVALAYAAPGTPADARERLAAYLASQADEVAANLTGSFSAANAAALLVLGAHALDDAAGVYGATDPVARLRRDAQNTSLGVNEKIYVLGALARARDAEAAAGFAQELRERLADPADEFLAKDCWFRSSAVLALLAAGDDPDSETARDWARSLLAFQERDKGFRSSVEYPADASTTSNVVAVLQRVPFVYSHEVETGAEFLRALQQPDGSVKFSNDADFARTKTTAEAVLAWTGKGPFG